MYVLTIWLCAIAHPACNIKDDPTGPPLIYEFHSRSECIDHVLEFLDTAPAPPIYQPRYTCAPKEVDL